MPIDIKLDLLIVQRRISLTELSKRVRISMSNLSILKNNKAKAIRLSMLEALCKVLECELGDLITLNEPESQEKL